MHVRCFLGPHHVSCDSRMMYPGHHRCKSAGLSFFHDLQAMRSRSAQRAAEDDNLDIRLSLGSGSPRSIGWRRRRRDHARFVCKDYQTNGPNPKSSGCCVHALSEVIST